MSTDTSAPTGDPGPPPRQGYPPLSALRRSRTDRKLVGVAGGLGRWAGVDPLVFRILFVVLAVFGGSGILLYAVGWLLIADDGEDESEGQRLLRGHTASSTVGTVVAGIVALILGLVLMERLAHTGPGLGGLGALIAVIAIVVLISRNNRGVPGPDAGPPPVQAATPPQEPGAFGQTPGTAYSAPAAAPPATYAPSTYAPSAYAPTGPVPPPPGGPTYPTYGPPVPVQPPAPPRERSYLGRATLSLALIVVGLLVGWNAATTHDVPAEVVVASALGVVGLGLIVGAFAGRARGLVVWGVLLTLVASVTALSGVPVRGGVGDRTWAPATVAELQPTYRLAAGQSELDLSRLDLANAGRTRVNLRQGIGDAEIVVPSGVIVLLDANVDAGEIRLPGRVPVNGTNLSERTTMPPGSAPSAAVLVLDVQLGAGSLEVRRAAS